MLLPLRVGGILGGDISVDDLGGVETAWARRQIEGVTDAGVGRGEERQGELWVIFGTFATNRHW